jgi:hypothetical protein
MNQDELIAKLTPAIGLRLKRPRGWGTSLAKYADPVLTVRVLRREESISPDTDVIMLTSEANEWHRYPGGLATPSADTAQVIWFPGKKPARIRVLWAGIHPKTHEQVTIIRTFAGTAEQITAAVAAAKAADAWTNNHLTGDTQE